MQITLKPVKSSIKVFNYLEKNGFVARLKPTRKTIDTRTKTGAVDILYTSNKNFGAHRLMCIGKRNKTVQMTYHLDNEDLIFLNPWYFLLILPLFLMIFILYKSKNNKMEFKFFDDIKFIY